jgi:transforming growth factor-beta-induced protein
MLPRKRLFAASILGLALTTGAVLVGVPGGWMSSSARAADAPAAQPAKDIVDTAVADGHFKTLAAALKAADLIDTLKGTGPFTVFAPTDDAFAKLPEGTVADLLKPENKEKLKAILTYHVVAGKAMAKDVAGMSSTKTVNGKDLSLKVVDGKVLVGGSATVTTADIETSNGVIHVIDTVLMP